MAPVSNAGFGRDTAVPQRKPGDWRAHAMPLPKLVILVVVVVTVVAAIVVVAVY